MRSSMLHVSSSSLVVRAPAAIDGAGDRAGVPIAPTNTSAGFFPHSHNIAITNSSLTSIDHFTQILHSGATEACHLLEQNRTSGAEMDSAARHPPPRCHPKTRVALRGRVTTWLNKPDRRSHGFWILGPVGVGKSAIAQTIAEHCHDVGTLGATFFFSKRANDAKRVIATLVHQLLIRFPDYKRIVVQVLTNDSTIFEKNLRSQFKSLIVEPFTILKAQGSPCVRQPLLIVIDGLNECQPEAAQYELMELINHCSQSSDPLPLLWLVCSRPTRRIKGMLSRPGIHCECEELRLDDLDSRDDVYYVLQDGLVTIREDSDVFDEGWPSEGQLQQLADAVAGRFPFASALLELIGDKDFNNPRFRLEACLRTIEDVCSGDAADPSQAMDLYRQRVLSHNLLEAPPVPASNEDGTRSLCSQEDLTASITVADTNELQPDQPNEDAQDPSEPLEIERDTMELINALQSFPRRPLEEVSEPWIQVARLIVNRRDNEIIEQLLLRNLTGAINTSLDLARASSLLSRGAIEFCNSLAKAVPKIEDIAKIANEIKTHIVRVTAEFLNIQHATTSAVQDVNRKLSGNRPAHQILIFEAINAKLHLERARTQLTAQDRLIALFINWWKHTEERLVRIENIAQPVPPEDPSHIGELRGKWKSLNARLEGYVSSVHPIQV